MYYISRVTEISGVKGLSAWDPDVKNPWGLLCAGPSEPKAVLVTMNPAGNSLGCLEGSNWEPLPPRRFQQFKV